MKWGQAPGWLVLFGVLACGSPPAPVPPRDLPRTVAVLPPNNRTGDPLLVEGASFFEKYALRSDRVTVPDVLASEARGQLARRGFTVVPREVVDAATGGRSPASPEAAAELATRGKLEGVVLYTEIDRWEPDVPLRPTFVLVGMTVRLVDPGNGRTLWAVHRSVRPIATPGSINAGSAYTIAAQEAMEELLGPLGPERPPPGP